MDREYVIYQQLKHLGVPASLLGYTYLHKAIDLVLEHPEYLHQMTRTLYPEVARAYGSTSHRVERAMRHAVEYVFDHTDASIVYQYFGNTVDPECGKVTNTQFIANVVEYIKMEVYHD